MNSRGEFVKKAALAAYCVICFAALLAPVALIGAFNGAVNTETEAVGSTVADASMSAPVSPADGADSDATSDATDTSASDPIRGATGAKESNRSIWELGDAFEKSFGLRKQLIWLDAQMRESFFGESSNARVTLGKDGWLFLSETLDRTAEANNADDGLIWRTARTLALANEYLTGAGTRFFVAVAPNKAQIYPEFLPYYAGVPRDADGRTPLDRLHEALAASGVPYVDLLAELKSAKAFAGNMTASGDDGSAAPALYHKLDTHWNNLGAMAAYRAIAGRASELIIGDGGEFEYESYENLRASRVENWRGDLENMLEPGSARLDDQYDFAVERAYTSRRPIANLDDMEIITRSRENSVRAVFFRDSFANAQLSLLSNNFGQATYLRAAPFAFWRAADEGADIAVLTIIERNIFGVVSRPPVIPAPVRGGIAELAEGAGNIPAEGTAALWETMGGYDKLTGYYDPALTGGAAARAYIVFTEAGESFDAARDSVYEAYPALSADAREDAVGAYGAAAEASGFVAYINAEAQGLIASDYDVRLLIILEDGGQALFTDSPIASYALAAGG